MLPAANDVLRNDVMLRINDVALRANGFFPPFRPRVLKNTANCAIINPERRWGYEKNIFCFVMFALPFC